MSTWYYTDALRDDQSQPKLYKLKPGRNFMDTEGSDPMVCVTSKICLAVTASNTKVAYILKNLSRVVNPHFVLEAAGI